MLAGMPHGGKPNPLANQRVDRSSRTRNACIVAVQKWALALLATIALGCVAAPTAPSRPLASAKLAIDKRGLFLPTPLDGPRLLAKNVELQLPRGCAPLDIPSFVRVASLVDDEESEFLGGCNLGDDAGRPRVTIVLIRHRMTLETGEDAAASLRRAPGTLDVRATTAGPTAGNALGPEVVVSTNVPTGA
jgi:hypothetical protein